MKQWLTKAMPGVAGYGGRFYSSWIKSLVKSKAFKKIQMPECFSDNKFPIKKTRTDGFNNEPVRGFLWKSDGKPFNESSDKVQFIIKKVPTQY